jgi:putative endonuclease
MFYVYLLYSSTFNKTYVGFTSDLESRLMAHNHVKNKGWTKRYQPWEVIYTEKFETKQAAMLREKELKTSKGRDFIAQLLKSR